MFTMGLIVEVSGYLPTSTVTNYDPLAESFALTMLEREAEALDLPRALRASDLTRMAMRFAVVPRREKRRQQAITQRQKVPP